MRWFSFKIRLYSCVHVVRENPIWDHSFLSFKLLGISEHYVPFPSNIQHASCSHITSFRCYIILEFDIEESTSSEHFTEENIRVNYKILKPPGPDQINFLFLISWQSESNRIYLYQK